MNGWPPKRECPHCASRERSAVWSPRLEFWYCLNCKRRWCEVHVIPYWKPPVVPGSICFVPPAEGEDWPALHIFNEWSRKLRTVPVKPCKPPPDYYKVFWFLPEDEDRLKALGTWSRGVTELG